MKMFVLAALAATVAAPAAHAASFTFTETMANGQDMANGGAVVPVTVSGSFDGDLTGNLIGNLRNIAVRLNGVDFVGSGALFAGSFDDDAGTWRDGGAVVSLDGLANNFFLAEARFPDTADVRNYYYNYTAGGQSVAVDRIEVGTLHGLYGYTRPDQRNTLTVTQVTGSVPEPASWALMILGLGVVGAGMRRRPARPALA